MPATRRRILAGGVAVLAAGVIAGCGSSGGGVTAAVRGQEGAVNTALKALETGNTHTAAARAAYHAKLQAVVTKLNHAVATVSRAKASTATQQTGQRQWIAAARQTIGSVTDLEDALSASDRGAAAAAKRDVRAAESALPKATALGQKADKLLGVAG